MKYHPDCANGCQYAKDGGVWPEQYAILSDGPPEEIISDKEELKDTPIPDALTPAQATAQKLVGNNPKRIKIERDMIAQCPTCGYESNGSDNPEQVRRIMEFDSVPAAVHKLVEQWASREWEVRTAGRFQDVPFPRAAELALCRRELQAAFGLGSLGSAPQPPSDSESASA